MSGNRESVVSAALCHQSQVRYLGGSRSFYSLSACVSETSLTISITRNVYIIIVVGPVFDS